MSARVSSGPDSRQDYSTPADFMAAVTRLFGPIAFDLAAQSENAKAACWYGPGGDRPDALAESARWAPLGGVCWLNPPVADIAPWARKCSLETGVVGDILLLVPAAVGANWFRDYVAPFARIYLLNGRLSFDGQNLYPKDCLLAHYKRGEAGMVIWNWKRDELYTEWVSRDGAQLALGGGR